MAISLKFEQMRTVFLVFFSSLCWLGCRQMSPQDYQKLPTFGESGVHVVVEIPAGSNHKIEYQKEERRFENDQEEGKDRVINFLPYPGNYGFIPSTYMDPMQGGDGDALDVLVIAESLPTGTVLETKPIATLLLKDNGDLDTKIIAIPVNLEDQVLPIANFQDFLIHHDISKRMIEQWFLNYKGPNEMQLIRWEDEQYAMQEIKKWQQ